jgi:uncharacterized protein (TIGR02284 family)
MADQQDAVKDVVEVLHDGQKGFADIGEHIKDPQIQAYFMKESQTRGEFARELEAAAGLGKDVGGTASGAAHRYWGDLKATMGGGDHTLLETAEEGEDAAKKAYAEALKRTDVQGPVRQTWNGSRPTS